MGEHDQAVHAAVRGVRLVVARDEFGDRVAELSRERGARGRRFEVQLGVEGEGREALLLAAREPHEAPDLADGARRERDQVSRGEAVHAALGVAREGPEGVRRHGVGGRRRDQAALGDATPLALVGDSREPALLERAQVVVGLLAGQADALGERRRRTRLRQLGQDPRPDRVQEGPCRRGVVDGFDVEHGGDQSLDKMFCQGRRGVLAQRVGGDRAARAANAGDQAEISTTTALVISSAMTATRTTPSIMTCNKRVRA